MTAQDEKQQPVQSREAPAFSGIGFKVGGEHLTLALAELSEVYLYAKHPRPSPVPAAPQWLRGMASLRGQLLPVIDLSAFLLGTPATPTRSSTVLVIKHPARTAGLLVDEVAGLKRFPGSDLVRKGQPFPGRISDFLKAVYQDDGVRWGVLSVKRLVNDPGFTEIAV